MAELNVTTVQLRDQQYDAVYHMVTAADGAEEYYGNSTNPARYETAEVCPPPPATVRHSRCGCGCHSGWQVWRVRPRPLSLQEARALDKRALETYLGHPHLRIIDNSTDFATKMERVLSMHPLTPRRPPRGFACGEVGPWP